MKKLITAMLIMILAGSVQAARLFDYRGVFPADRADDAKITNYILLNRDANIHFDIEEQGVGATERIKIVKVQLTSQPEIIFAQPEGIRGLRIPETGIYELTLVPAAGQVGEIRFILRVNEADETSLASGSLKVATSSPALSDKPVASATAVSEIVPVATRPLSVASLIVTDNGVPLATDATAVAGVPSFMSESASAASAIIPVASAGDFSQLVISSATSSGVVDTSRPSLQAPADGSFINPFAGFKFVGEGLNLLDDAARRRRFEITNQLADGSHAAVAGSFFSPEPDVLMFLPRQVLPGAVYYLKISDEQGNQSGSFTAVALPEVSIGFQVDLDKLLVSLSWQPQKTLHMSPAGQMLALAGCEVRVTDDNNLFLQLKDEQVTQPFGSQDQFSWRARPYALDIEMPQALVASECRVELLAAIDGSEQKIVAFKASWQKVAGDYDFSDVEASDDLVYAQPPEEFTIASFTAIESLAASNAFVIAKSFLLVTDEAEKQRSWPQDVVWDENGSLWVLDSQLRRLANYNDAGQHRISFGNRGKKAGEFGLPVALAQKNSTLFVSDTVRHAIHKFTTDGLFVTSILSGSSPGVVVDLPGGICFRKEEMWVADRGTARILCFNQQGGFLGSFGSTTVAPIEAPVSVRADEDSLYILEKSGLVKKFSPMGQFDATFQSGSRDGSGIEVDDWGGVWVCDSGKYRVVRFSRQGAVLAELKAPPAPKPWLPTAVAVRSDGKVAVTDASNKMLHLFVPAE